MQWWVEFSTQILVGLTCLNVFLLLLPANRLLTRLKLSRLYLAILFVPLAGGVLFVWWIAFLETPRVRQTELIW
jgi:hypothetical protein